MSWKLLRVAVFLSLCLGPAGKARAEKTPETLPAAEAWEREWRDNQKAIEDDTENIRLKNEEAEEQCRTMWSAAFQGNLPQATAAFREFQAAYLGRKAAYLHRVLDAMSCRRRSN